MDLRLHTPAGRRLFLVIGLLVMALALLVALGGHQFLVYRHGETMARSSNRLLFRFTAIREYLLQELITEQTPSPGQIAEDLEEVARLLSEIRSDPTLPDHIRLALLTRQDLLQIDLLLRQRQQELPRTVAKELDQELRQVQGRLFVCNQELLGHIARLRFRLHQMVAGGLALSLSVTATLLFLLHRAMTTLLQPAVQSLTLEGRQLALIGSLTGELCLALSNGCNAILNCGQLLLDNTLSQGETGPDLLPTLVNESRKTASLASSVAALAGLATQRSCSIAQMLDRLAELFTPLCTMHGIHLELNTEAIATPPAHSQLLQTVLLEQLEQARHLLISAPKEEAPPQIQVKARMHQEGVQISIAPVPPLVHQSKHPSLLLDLPSGWQVQSEELDCGRCRFILTCFTP
jgi:hypothetical protein